MEPEERRDEGFRAGGMAKCMAREEKEWRCVRKEGSGLI